jgi:hypothetical protein
MSCAPRYGAKSTARTLLPVTVTGQSAQGRVREGPPALAGRVCVQGRETRLLDDAQRELAIPAVLLHQREPQRQQAIDDPARAGITDEGRV